MVLGAPSENNITIIYVFWVGKMRLKMRRTLLSQTSDFQQVGSTFTKPKSRLTGLAP